MSRIYSITFLYFPLLFKNKSHFKIFFDAKNSNSKCWWFLWNIWIFAPKLRLKISEMDFYRENSEIFFFRKWDFFWMILMWLSYLIVFLSKIPNKRPQIVFGFDRFGVDSHRNFENCRWSIPHHLSKVWIHSFIIPKIQNSIF